MKSYLKFSVFIRIIAVLLLFWALDRHSYGYYSMLRFVTFGVGIYLVYISLILNKVPWAWVFGMIALIFNPIFPIHLGREIWAYVDIITGIIFLSSIFFIREDSK